VKTLKLLVSAAVAVAMLALPGAALAKSRDRDHDKMPDKWEKAHHLSTHKKNAKRDPDRDGLSNIREFHLRMNPRDADTDNDGVKDGNENGGTITAFDPQTGELTIQTASNHSVTGLVTDQTEIECENAGDAEHQDEHGDDNGDASAAHHGDEGDNSGPGRGDDGDDNDGHGDDNDDENEGDQCSTADLTPGAAVHEAELGISSQGDVWEKVELLK
jgi:hypothetical protein